MIKTLPAGFEGFAPSLANTHRHRFLYFSGVCVLCLCVRALIGIDFSTLLFCVFVCVYTCIGMDFSTGLGL